MNCLKWAAMIEFPPQVADDRDRSESLPLAHKNGFISPETKGDFMENHSHTIASWPSTEKPRERLLSEGPQALSTAELLAILLRTGMRGKDAVFLGRELLSKEGGLRTLFSKSAHEMCSIKGMGNAKACTLLAAAELGKRVLKEEKSEKIWTIKDPESVISYLYADMRDLKREVFKVFFLNKAHECLAEENLFHGTVDEAKVYPAEIIRAALMKNAPIVLLVHNHPSGRIQPSEADKKLTQAIEKACALVGIRVLDHLIIGNNQYFSFSQHGLLNYD